MKKDKLHKIAPILSEISKENSIFKVPENYFNEIEDVIFAELKTEAIQQKTKKLSFTVPQNYFNTVENITISKLKAEVLHKQQSEAIPINYFDTLEDKVFAKIKTKQKIILLKNITKFVAPIAIAASLLLIFTLNFKQQTISFDSLATSEIEQFIELGLIDFDSESLATVYNIEIPTDNLTISLSNNEVLDYLTDEDLESLIYEN
jgi:hypothetical protein